MKIIYFSVILILLFFMMLGHIIQFRNIDEFVPAPEITVEPGHEKIELLPPTPISAPNETEIPTDSLQLHPKITACFL